MMHLVNIDVFTLPPLCVSVSDQKLSLNHSGYHVMLNQISNLKHILCRFKHILRVSLSSGHTSPVTLGTFTVTRLLHWDTKRKLVRTNLGSSDSNVVARHRFLLLFQSSRSQMPHCRKSCSKTPQHSHCNSGQLTQQINKQTVLQCSLNMIYIERY